MSVRTGYIQQYSAQTVEELDELTYKRFRSETNHSQSLTDYEAQRIRELVSELWQVPRVRPGNIVAGARLQEIIGKGAFGTVWKAEELDTHNTCAVKIFDADRLGDGLAVHLFRRGVRAMLYLRSQNNEEQSRNSGSQELSKFIVKIRQIEPHMLAFSMDWLSGGDLSKGYIRGRSLDEKLRIFRHISQAILYAHTRPSRIVHRDIKPQNIVMHGSTPILTDFDIADMAFAKTLSRRAVGGAFAYAAPEQLTDDCGHLELRSDVYSLGRLLHFFLLEEDPPILIERNPPLEELNTYPEGLVKIIRRCTHRELPMRYASVDELLRDLDRYEQSDQVGAYGPNHAMAERYWKQAQHHAVQKSWKDAIYQAQQAQQYLQTLDEKKTERWTQYILWWRFRAGEWRILPDLLYLSFRRLSLVSAIVLTLLLLSPLGVPVIQWFQAKAKNEQIERALTYLLTTPSLKSQSALNSLSFIRQKPKRRTLVLQRLTILLSTSTIEQSCRIFSLLYRLSPRSRQHIAESAQNESQSISQQRIVEQALPLFISNKWGPIQCPEKSQFPWLRLSKPTPPKKKTIKVQLHIKKSFLRFLSAPYARLDGSILRGSNLSGSVLNNAHFYHVDLRQVDLRASILTGAKFSHAKLQAALLQFADLRSAKLRGNMSFANFREAKLKHADFTYIDLTGALFSSSAVRYLHAGHLHKKYFKHAICLSQGVFFMKSPALLCHQWHRNRYLKKPNVHKRPNDCPAKLSRFSLFIAYPPGHLQREGQCPWQAKQLPSLTTQSQTTSRPTTQPTRPVIPEK